MNGPAWIFAVGFIVSNVLLVLALYDRDEQKKRADAHRRTLTELMARYAALSISLRLAGYHVPSVEVIDVTDVHTLDTSADIPWMRVPRQGGDAS